MIGFEVFSEGLYIDGGHVNGVSGGSGRGAGVYAKKSLTPSEIRNRGTFHA